MAKYSQDFKHKVVQRFITLGIKSINNMTQLFQSRLSSRLVVFGGQYGKSINGLSLN